MSRMRSATDLVKYAVNRYQPTHDECARGALNQSEEDKRRGGLNMPNELRVSGGRLGGKNRVKMYGNPKTDAGSLLGSVNQAREHKVRGGQVACHNRFHVARGITNPKCAICCEEADGNNHKTAAPR
jgi:hypothetical protein